VQLVATFHACKLHPLPPPPAMTIAPPPAEGTLCVELVGCDGLAGFKGQSTAGLTSDDDTYVKLALQVCDTGTPATQDRMSIVTRRSQIGGAHPRMEARQSHICRRTSAPRFKQTFRFSITANDLDLGVDFTLHATVYDSMAIGADNFRGETAFSVGEALGAAGSEGWLRQTFDQAFALRDPQVWVAGFGSVGCSTAHHAACGPLNWPAARRCGCPRPCAVTRHSPRGAAVRSTLHPMAPSASASTFSKRSATPSKNS
jgi:hypothetical protein